jgi:hypothetical protein
MVGLVFVAFIETLFRPDYTDMFWGIERSCEGRKSDLALNRETIPETRFVDYLKSLERVQWLPFAT